jgi:hypothetical protein
MTVTEHCRDIRLVPWPTRPASVSTSQCIGLLRLTTKWLKYIRGSTSGAVSADQWSKRPDQSPRASWRGTATLIARKSVHSPVVVTAIRDEANLLARPPLTRRLRHASPAAPPTGAAPAARHHPAPTAGPARPHPTHRWHRSGSFPENRRANRSPNNTPFHRLNDFAATNRPNNGCVSATTRTPHGKTARNCCSLSPSLQAPGEIQVKIKKAAGAIAATAAVFGLGAVPIAWGTSDFR